MVITEGKGYFCFADHKGGDQIALVAHIMGLSTKDAAQWIVGEHCTSTVGTSSRQSVPESENGSGSKLAPLAYLEPEHDAVVAIGFDPSVAKSLGIGYAPRGIMRGTVAVPIRDEHGALKGYIGIEDARLPADFQSNVVPFQKRA